MGVGGGVSYLRVVYHVGEERIYRREDALSASIYAPCAGGFAYQAALQEAV
jgi:hypothetical protein